MKSMAILAHGLEGMGRGWNSPMRAAEDVLFLAQTEQAPIYSRTSGSMDGHQNLWEMVNIVRRTP